MNDDVTDWKDLREFKGVDLTKSFVLSWDTDALKIRFSTELNPAPIDIE